MNFSMGEMLLVVLIALLVIKPDQLPDAAYTLGKFFKSIQGMFSKVKSEMSSFIDSVEKPVEKKREQE